MPLNPTLLGRKVWTYDMEVFPNWYCCTVSDGERFMVFQPGQMGTLKELISDRVILAGFNCFEYDDPILAALLANPNMTPASVCALSALLIDDANPDNRERIFRLRYADRPWFASIDVFQLLNGKASLKELACRIHAPDVRETPYAFDAPLPAEGVQQVIDYCKTDVMNTTILLHKHWEKVTLREKLDEQFNIGARIYHLPEQGIAQAVFVGNYRKRSTEPMNSAALRTLAGSNAANRVREWKLSDIMPSMRFTTNDFLSLYSRMWCNWSAVRLNETGTAWALKNPSGVGDKVCQVRLADRMFQLGVGGLHSIDHAGRWDSNDRKLIIDLDVTSYYPSIIINRKLEPAHWDGQFSSDMRTLRDQRVAAKRAGDKVTAEALKIVVNSTFGKLNDFYSPFRSVPDALRVTVGGQMYLLRLIELLHSAGARILSANTDGVTIMWERDMVEMFLDSIIAEWQHETGFELERADYTSYARRDVNNYVAISTTGKIKTKGAFHTDTGKGDGLVVKNAAIAALTGRGTVASAIAAAKPTDFVFYQRCRNGGEMYHGDMKVGRLARWVVVRPPGGGQLRRKNPAGNWANIADAESVALCMELSQIDSLALDLDWYAAQAQALVDSTRFAHRP